ncbi:hypothetical protein [Listeria monocytogenes]|uniref:hypothetical protein n=1 Tax=Listeria monocytogenes TaxID=1639 RepID=UPI0011EAE195|nr:hypothetical protein [Listeria monocytogenes]TYV33101.1 hypothetical protein FZ060_14775 [Listeria monocytogenes]
MDANQARNQADNAYVIFLENDLEPYIKNLLPSILERIELRTMDKKYTVNIAIQLKRLYELSPSGTRYRKVKQDAMQLMFDLLEEKGYQVRVRTEAMLLGRILWKYEGKCPLIRISW